ncbi:hypothetical protein D3C87_1181020 [compost metagenome]
MLELDPNEFKRALDINDNRTLKKSLSSLFKNSYLRSECKIVRGKPLTIEINEERFKLNDNFTQLPTKLLSMIKEIGCVGVRLLYYYESYIIRSKVRNQFCYAAIDSIYTDTGISQKTILKYNELLRKAKLLKIEKHELKTDYEYTEADELIFTRYNNHYYVRLENIL